ncbi:mediator of RNA polymerase II transcription subunit 1-domain-containing protein [Podospora conica]|nr:mediator of RNA polymerase II transcription subunit 1-domain-containing protein [Schizothecium conicum]
MATPNANPLAMKHSSSQQGKTPSQSQQGAAATPLAGFSPYGPRSSPQAVKKSPANAATMMNHPSAINNPSSAPTMSFDSPSTAAFNALQISGGLDLGLSNMDGLGPPPRDPREDFIKKLDGVIAILGQTKGLVSEASLERLAKKLELEVFWENDINGNKSLVVGGSQIELLINFSSPDVVESVSLNFPLSGDIVTKHAESASRIFAKNLQLDPGQTPLTKKMDSFVDNFERIATLDRLSDYPSLNLLEAVAGIYESLHRLHQYELQATRNDPASQGLDDELVQTAVLCTKSGIPAMNARERVGLTLDFWTEKRKLATATRSPEWKAKRKIWCTRIGCAPLGGAAVNPVRVSDRWIGESVVKMALAGDLEEGLIDWLQPDNTLIMPDPSKDGNQAMMHSEPPLLGPRLPGVAFLATFDPPIHTTLPLMEGMQHQLGCVFTNYMTTNPVSYESLLRIPSGTGDRRPESPTVTCFKQVAAYAPGCLERTSQRHCYNLFIHKPVCGQTVTDVLFEHPQQIITMLPYLRQYAFLSALLENSLNENPTPSPPAEAPPAPTPKTSSRKVRTNMADLDELVQETAAPPPAVDAVIDVTLDVNAVPQLQVVFPFRDGTATVEVEIRANGAVHVVSQSVLDERNSVAPDGRQRRVEDIGAALELFEDIGRWCEFMRTRWA